MVPERDRAPVAIDGRVPNVENRQECAPACADIRSPEKKNIADGSRRHVSPANPHRQSTLQRASDRCSLRGHRSIPRRCFPAPAHHRCVTHAARPEGSTTVMTDHAPEATLLIKWLENKMNYSLLWNSSKLSSGRETETPRNKSRRSNMLSHPRKLLSSSMDGAGKIFYHPARSTQQHIKPARTVGAVRDADGASGLAACRRSDCDRNADCRQDVLRTRQHRCSAGRATGCDA